MQLNPVVVSSDVVDTTNDEDLSSRTYSGFRTELAEKIFFDRYSLKNPDRTAIKAGDLVVFKPDIDPRKETSRELGFVQSVEPITKEVRIKYKYQNEYVTLPIEYVDKPTELTWNDLCARVASAIAKAEINESDYTLAYLEFKSILNNQMFIPGGRILAGAGSPGDLTFYNCFVLPSPKDSRKGILNTATQQLEIMSRGGGVGINVSSLRPQYDYVAGVNGRSSGAVSWSELYSFLTGLVEQGGSRRGALMVIMDVWHPEIERFIEAKEDLTKLLNANISVGMSDAFMTAVKEDKTWDLVFPDRTHPDYEEEWDGSLETWLDAGRPVKTYARVKAADLYKKICKSAWKSAEPGVFFTDVVNRYSNSGYYERIRCTNPCGEQPLPSWGVCNLGAINLAKFVDKFYSYEDRFTPNVVNQVKSRFDFRKLEEVTRISTHFLDNVIDSTSYIFNENEIQQKQERRVGLGVMGLAEMLIRLGVPYGTDLATAITESVFETIRNSAYWTSVELAKKKGPFPKYSKEYLDSKFCQGLPSALRGSIEEHGIRNVTLLTVAPTGTTGTMMATSTGIEPYFMFQFRRNGRLGTHIVKEAVVNDFVQAAGYEVDVSKVETFVTTEMLQPLQHIKIMAAAQKFVDSAISKTCNLPASFTVEDIEKFYMTLYDSGCKGGTVYRDSSRDKQVLEKVETPKPATPKVQVLPLPKGPRPGYSYSTETPLGRVHVTLNVDPKTKQPFDVFVTLSKPGSDISADTDGIARLLSLILRMNVDIPAEDRLKLAINQLQGIAGSNSVGFGANKVRSVVDGIAKCLAALLDQVKELNSIPVQPLEKSNGNGAHSENASFGGAFLETCPECRNVSAVHVDNCFKCVACGFSMC